MQKKTSIMKEGESNCRGTEMAGQTMDKSTTKNCYEFLEISSPVMYGRHCKIIGKCIRGNIITKVILVKLITT
jgi:hypothetical protein